MESVVENQSATDKRIAYKWEHADMNAMRNQVCSKHLYYKMPLKLEWMLSSLQVRTLFEIVLVS